jgi:hypothetical protein
VYGHAPKASIIWADCAPNLQLSAFQRVLSTVKNTLISAIGDGIYQEVHRNGMEEGVGRQDEWKPMHDQRNALTGTMV